MSGLDPGEGCHVFDYLTALLLKLQRSFEESEYRIHGRGSQFVWGEPGRYQTKTPFISLFVWPLIH